MTGVFSLRVRLTAIILVPLVGIVSGLGLWQLSDAQNTAKNVLDRALLTAALAVARDVAVTEGDALSPATAQLLENTSGGLVFYHVYAPDGVIVTGYASPPVGIPRPNTELAEPLYFDAIYQGRDVSGVRLQTPTEVEGFSGLFTTTVWQDSAVRDSFVRDLARRGLLGLGAVLASVALIVWFGVRYGLRPLTDLENAIARRSSDDLSTIRRAVPEEVTGITETLNRLFEQLQAAFEAQSTFIANAAHQLRNPIAGILSLAEATLSAKTPQAMRQRTEDLLQAARKTSQLAEQLLLYERAKTVGLQSGWALQDAEAALTAWIADCRPLVPATVRLETDVDLQGLRTQLDSVMLQEALKNLVSNAVLHGGPGLSEIQIGARQTRETWSIWVQDDGRGIPEDKLDLAATRFAQVGSGEGSGLGLSITQQIAVLHGGQQTLATCRPGLRVTLTLPVRQMH